MPPPPPARSRPSGTPPGAPPLAHAGPLPSPRLLETPRRREGPYAPAPGDAERAGPARTRRGRLCSGLAGSALVPLGPPPTPPAPAAPSPAAAAAAPLLSPAPLLSSFFPFLRGEGGRAKPSRGRGGARRRRPRTGRRRRGKRRAASPAGLPALPNLSLSETGSRIGSQRPHYGLHQALYSFQITH